MTRLLLAGAAAAVLTLTGCGLTIPTDPNGTLESVRGGALRVGASPNGELVIADDSNSVSGSEAELIETFADTLDANIEWTVASEETLVRGLENDELDVVIAGMGPRFQIWDRKAWNARRAASRALARKVMNGETTRAAGEGA